MLVPGTKQQLKEYGVVCNGSVRNMDVYVGVYNSDWFELYSCGMYTYQ